MKKLLTVSVSMGIAFALSGCSGVSSNLESKASQSMLVSASKINEKEACNVQTMGLDKVINVAKKYNKAAIEEGVEFRRLNVNNSALIMAVEAGIKSGAKEVEPKTFKGKPSKQKFDINFAAERACKFALGALRQKETMKTAFRDAIPGDGKKY